MMTLGDFMNSSAGRETRWYADQNTNEVVGFCPSCRAELRFGIDGPSEWQFGHQDSCPHSDEKRAQRLIGEMITVLEQETDNDVAFASVTFLFASMCTMAAEEVEVPLDMMAERFVRAFKERVRELGPVMKIVSAASENAA